MKNTSLQAFKTIDETIEIGVTVLNQDTVGNTEEFEKLVQQYSEMEIDGIEDIAGYQLVKKEEKNLKSMIAKIKKRRKEITAPAIEFQKKLIAEEERLIGIVQPILTKVSTARQDFDDKAAAAALKRLNERCAELLENGYQLVGSIYQCGIFQITKEVINEQTDEEFAVYINEGKKEVERQRIEQERKEKERKELDEMRAELAKERQLMAEERAKLAKERAEIQAQTDALEDKYKEEEKPKPEPTPEVKPEPKPVNTVIEPVVKTQVSTEYMKGFNACRTIILDKFNSGDKMTRPDWIEFVKNA